MPNKKKTPSAVTLEAQSSIPHTIGNESMKNSTAHSKQSQLIAIDRSTVNGEEVQTVNARELHQFLESKQDFSTWIKKRISDYGFIENIDYLTLHKKMERQILIDYYITIEMAKELSMVERNDKGKEMRQYFIECEKKAKSKELPLNDPAFLRGTLLTYTEKVIELEHKVEELEPKAKFHDKVIATHDSLSLSKTAKTLGTGRNKLCRVMREHKWLRRNNEPYQDKIDQGLLDVKLSNWEHPHNGLQQAVTALVTGKGLAKLSQMLSGNV